MLNKSFSAKIIIPTIIVLTAMVVALNVFLHLGFSAQRDNLINEKLIENTNSLKQYLDVGKANTVSAAAAMSWNPYVIKALQEQNRDELLRVFTSSLTMFNVDYYTVTDNAGTVLIRTYDPDNFGDSIGGQQNVKDALAGQVSTYFEEGTMVKVSVRSGSPVYDSNGALIGVISAGIRFDTDSAVEALKKIINSEVTVFFGGKRISTTITMDGHNIAGTTIDPAIAEIVIKNKLEYTGDSVILGAQYKTFYMPFINSHNEAFATFVFGFPKTEIVETSNKLLRNGILFGFGGLLVSIVLLFIIISSISKPITKLSDDMDKLAGGNLGIQISVKSNDEVGRLARSIQKTADTLHKLHENINKIISEHEKGNTDYYFKTDEFSGDYKTLGQSVLKIASFSMIDQLTGLANRRSFDNRINLEWKRAIQETLPLSILMINIDHYKNYYDKYGHKQGEVALKTVANTLKRLARPSIDIVARLEGDEFIILSPAADSNSAMDLAKKICAEIEKTIIPGADLEGSKITISIGVNTQTPTQGKLSDKFLSLADNALNKAKSTEQNSVVFAVE